MKQDKFANLYNDSHMPGQSFTKPRQTMPYDRPSDDASVEKFLDKLFKKLTQPKIASQFLALMDAKVPLDILVRTLVQSAFGEGKINANMVFLVVPPLTVMLWRMSEAAGIDPVLSSDGQKEKIPEILLRKNMSSNRVNKAVHAAKSSADLRDMPKKGGLMKRPEGVI